MYHMINSAAGKINVATDQTRIASRDLVDCFDGSKFDRAEEINEVAVTGEFSSRYTKLFIDISMEAFFLSLSKVSSFCAEDIVIFL